jgi:hypothetical protein
VVRLSVTKLDRLGRSLEHCPSCGDGAQPTSTLPAHTTSPSPRSTTPPILSDREYPPTVRPNRSRDPGGDVVEQHLVEVAQFDAVAAGADPSLTGVEQGEDPSRLTERATLTAQAPQPHPADLDEAIGFWTCSIRDATRSSVAEGVLSSLLVVLDFRDRTRGRTVGVLPGVLAGAALAEQVPALIECYLDPTELVAFLAGGQFAGLDPVPQLMLAGDEGLDLRERVWLIHHISVVSVVAALIVECWNRDTPE